MITLLFIGAFSGIFGILMGIPIISLIWWGFMGSIFGIIGYFLIEYPRQGR